MSHLTDDLAFRTGAVRHRNLGYVMATALTLDQDEIGNGVVLSWSAGTWGAYEPLSWSPTSSCVASFPKHQFVGVGGDDSFMAVGQGDYLEGNILAQLTAAKDGIVRAVRDIEGWAYAVGTGGLAVKRTDLSAWIRVDWGLPDSLRLEAIHGFSESDMYAVGWEGAVWHFDGVQWRPCAVPTNAILSCVACAGDGWVYVGGQNGVLLQGRLDSWKAVTNEATSSHIWDLEWFNGKLYAATYLALYAVEAAALVQLDLGDAQPESAYHLSSADEMMWSVGEKDIVVFDGTAWRALPTAI